MKGTILKNVAITVLLCAVSAFAQSQPAHNKAAAKKAPAATAPAAPSAPAPEPAKPDVPAPDAVTPKETLDSVKLELALEKQQKLSADAQSLQTQAMQAIEPRMVPLRAEYQKQIAAAKAEEDIVRKENGWGPDIKLDSTLGSPTFGSWIKIKPPAK